MAKAKAPTEPKIEMVIDRVWTGEDGEHVHVSWEMLHDGAAVHQGILKVDRGTTADEVRDLLRAIPTDRKAELHKLTGERITV